MFNPMEDIDCDSVVENESEDNLFPGGGVVSEVDESKDANAELAG